MRRLFSITLIAFLLTGCASLSYQNVIETGVAGTQMALPTATISPVTALPPTEMPPSPTPSPAFTETPFTITDTLPAPSETPAPSESIIVNGQVGGQANCGNSLIVKVPEAPEFKKDLFEHHATGTFLILKLDLVNTTSQSIQIWDGDYAVESDIDGVIKSVKPHRAATTYLYIQRGGKLMQDQVEPGVTNWETNLAFDVDQQSKNWVLVFKPGFEGGQALCECRINLTTSE